jgi:O-antigen ligase
MKMTESFVARWISIGAALVTLLVTANVSMDPVNVPKLLLVSGLGISMWAIIIGFNVKAIWADNRPLFLATLAYLALGTLTLFVSSAPITQNFYGVQGRNTGFLAYLALTGIMLAASQLRTKKSFTQILYGLFAAGILNVIYCLIALSGNDFIPWNNIYNKILGTFGNPNFVSAFLGIFITALVAYLFKPGINLSLRITGMVLAVVALYEVQASNAIQGFVVSAFGISIVGFYLIRSYFKKNIFTLAYVSAVAVVGAVALAGALQKGPLTQYIYKTSVSLRGEYWDAGITMALTNPLTGVGLDTYGDWYRRARSASAMILPGPSTVTNAAHNVFIDVLASGGFIFFAVYLTIFIIALISVLKVTLRNRSYDALFVALATAWICYNVQALISINQIGLAIWGWLLSGTVIAYEHATRGQTLTDTSSAKLPKKQRSYAADTQPGVVLAGVGGFIVGLIIALPPFTADASYRSALKAGQLNAVVAAANKFPLDSLRMAQAVATFEDNKAFAEAHEMALRAVKYNPDSFDAWRLLGFISTATPEEKKLANSNLQRLDPRNEEWKKVAP